MTGSRRVSGCGGCTAVYAIVPLAHVHLACVPCAVLPRTCLVPCLRPYSERRRVVGCHAHGHSRAGHVHRRQHCATGRHIAGVNAGVWWVDEHPVNRRADVHHRHVRRAHAGVRCVVVHRHPRPRRCGPGTAEQWPGAEHPVRDAGHRRRAGGAPASVHHHGAGDTAWWRRPGRFHLPGVRNVTQRLACVVAWRVWL